MDNKLKDDSHLWNQFCRLGEMIGDGMHHEEPWIAKEYKRLQEILVPEVKEVRKKQRKARVEQINEFMASLVKQHNCKCGGKFKQTRSGSKTVICVECNHKAVARTKKNKAG